MRRIRVAILFQAIITFVFCFPCNDAQSSNETGDSKPRVILLCFDGLDANLVKSFMDQGQLPAFHALAEGGCFLPVETTNPAQSPTAWASFISGKNPGKTNIPGFIKRTCDGWGVGPALATVEDSYQGAAHTVPYKTTSEVEVIAQGEPRTEEHAIDIPERVPVPYNLHQGDFFWDLLGKKGVKFMGLFVPGTYPCIAGENCRILGGLGTPDIGGDTGTWYIYTDDEWVIRNQNTRTGGRIVRVIERGGVIRGVFYGPRNFVQERYFKERLAQLEGRELKKLEREYRLWLNDEKKKLATVKFSLKTNRRAGKATITVADQTQELAVGQWSDWFHLTFEITPAVNIPAIARLKLLQCDKEGIRIFVPSINISPNKTPECLKISTPHDFASEVYDLVGPYQTVGWSALTHGLKDEEISEEDFLEGIEFTFNCREKVLNSQISSGDYDVIMMVFSGPDRVQHMMCRLTDCDHPLYNVKHADRTTTFFGRKIKLKDAILESYRQADRVIGKVLARVKRGELGDDTVLMVASDHGIAPYYHGMNLNNFLVEKGYLKLIEDGKPVEFENIKDLRDSHYLGMVDWENTKAYSLGLGKIFINLEGREPNGIVKKADYDKIRDSIIGELEAYVDAQNNQQVVKKAYRREDIFSGDFWKEGEVDFVFNGTENERRRTDGFADIFVGFERGYRVSWNTTAGGLDESTIVENDSKWSGDHVSVAPEIVPGIFLSNVKFGGKAEKVSVMDIAPTILEFYGIEVPEDYDGKVLSDE